MRPHPLQTDDRAMSGKWQAFFAVMIFCFGTVLTLTFWPVASRERIADGGQILIHATDWLLEGLTGYVLIYGFVIVGWIMVIGAIYMAIEQVYLWVKRRRDDTVNEYQIK